MNVKVTKQYTFLNLLTLCDYDVFHLNPWPRPVSPSLLSKHYEHYEA